MKSTNTTLSRAFGSSFALAAFASLCLTAPALAKKGGGGKPGGDDPPPPPEPDAPVAYQVSWVEVPGSESLFYNINSDGVAAGSIRPAGDPTNSGGTGVIRFPDGELVDLEAVASTHADYRAGWRLTTVFSVSDSLLVSGDIYDPDGIYYTFAAQLVDNGPDTALTVSWFRIFSAPELGESGQKAVVEDASRDGHLTVRVWFTEFEDQISRTYIWNPATDTVLDTVLYEGWRINNQQEILRGNKFVDIGNGLPESTLPDGGRGRDLGDSGLVVGWAVSEARIKGFGKADVHAPAILANGTWEAIGPYSLAPVHGGAVSAAFEVNAADQIAGFADGALFLYSDDEGMGFRLVDDLLDPFQAGDAQSIWANAGEFHTRFGAGVALSEPDAGGFGWVCGTRDVGGSLKAYVLMPVVTP